MVPGERRPVQLFKGLSVDSKSGIRLGLEGQINALGAWNQTDPLTMKLYTSAEGDVQKH